MKKYITAVFLGLGLCAAALGGPSPIYNNFGVVTQAPVVDALAFNNIGDFEIDAVSSYSLTNLNNLFGNGYSVLPFMTKDTLYYTNSDSGFMLGIPGFRFDTGTSTSRHSAAYFLNHGAVESIDTEAFPYLFSVVGSTSFVPVPVDSQPIASQLLVLATNIVNTGSMTVGNYGLLNLVGSNVTVSYSTLVAGSVNTAGSITDPLDTTGLQGQQDWTSAGGNYYFVPSPGVYDLFWGVTNALTVDLAGFDPPNDIPDIDIASRGFGFGGGFFLNNFNTAEYSVTAIAYTNNGTNIYYNVIFLNTNFADTNISAVAGFTFASDPEDILTPDTDDPYAYEAIVKFSEPVYDIITGQTVTNGIYLMDDGAYLPTMVLADNASLPDGYSRPNAFELSTLTPFNWDEAPLITAEYAVTYDPGIYFPPQELANQKVPFEISEYGAQIGRNPAVLDGSFSSLINSNTLSFDYLDFVQVNLPDATNDPARIQISANNLDITQTRMRAEGMAIINASNIIGSGTATEDWGEANANIGVTNGSLVVSNLFPTLFHRLRGDVSAWSATWENSQTNGNFGNTNFPATNTVHYHVLVVNQNFYGTFPSSVRNLTLTGKKSIILDDSLNVINQVVLNTTNLTINSSNYFSQGAQDFTTGNAPYLQNLFINTNGVLGASSSLDIGYNLNLAQSPPTGRKYTINSITNFGQMMATTPLFESKIFENDGQVSSQNGGSIIIEANTVGLGLALTNATNYLYSQGSVDLSATAIQTSNSVIYAGTAGLGSLTLYVTKQLTDFVSGTPTTNTNSVIINHWTVTDGFLLPVKPAAGDLFGTEIHTIAAGFEQATHVWAGTDMGATPAGFVNNEVIGRLVLDRRSSSAALRFSAAGAKNAMYVDYLELTNEAYSNYRTGLVIDPNFTIYFADANADPEKLMEVYPRLVWVQNFAGPNSTQIVPYLNSSDVCLMNAALANSFEISFFNGVPNYYNQPYVLNDPNNPANVYPCPGDQTTLRSLLVATAAPDGGRTLNLMNITVNGEGSISPNLAPSQMALGRKYTLTATPAKGWVFENWQTIGLAGPVNANSAVLPFTFVNNTVITANFTPNPFAPLQGVYNGLFFDTNGVNPGSAGFFTLTLGASGVFSGQLLMGPAAYKFTSQFSGAGGSQFQAKSGAKALTLNLQLDVSGQTGQIRGDVNGGAWDAALAADIAPAWTAKNPSPLAGSYTMALPWDTGTVATPGGDSYGAGAVSKLGVLSMAGKLADGAPFSASAPVSKYGQWPFYAYAPSGNDFVLGWVSVFNGLSGTNVSWCKPAGKGPLFAAGFTNLLQLVGSPWQAPAKNSPALALTNPVVTLSGGGLPDTLSVDVALQNFLSYVGTNLTLTVINASGSFSGSFNNPGAGQKQAVSGVVLRNMDSARGFFLGTNESGAVLLQGR